MVSEFVTAARHPWLPHSEALNHASQKSPSGFMSLPPSGAGRRQDLQRLRSGDETRHRMTRAGATPDPGCPGRLAPNDRYSAILDSFSIVDDSVGENRPAGVAHRRLGVFPELIKCSRLACAPQVLRSVLTKTATSPSRSEARPCRPDDNSMSCAAAFSVCSAACPTP
jgi:hypothetical protein